MKRFPEKLPEKWHESCKPKETRNKDNEKTIKTWVSHIMVCNIIVFLYRFPLRTKRRNRIPDIETGRSSREALLSFTTVFGSLSTTAVDILGLLHRHDSICFLGAVKALPPLSMIVHVSYTVFDCKHWRNRGDDNERRTLNDEATKQIASLP